MITVSGNLSVTLSVAADQMNAAVRDATMRAATGLRDALAGQVRAAGLGNGLAKSWKIHAFRKGCGATIRTDARRLISAFSADTTIIARNARWLVLPLPAAINRGWDKSARQSRNGQPRRWSNVDAATLALGRLTFIPLSGNRGLLVHREGKGRSTPLFLLLKRVELRQRLDIPAVVGPWRTRARDEILQALGTAP